MKTCLQIAGTLQMLLAFAHFGFNRRFGWREELQKVSLFTRQVFFVHMRFLMLVLAGFGIVSLFCADDLLTPGRLPRVLLGGLTIFWVVRLYCQFFFYHPDLWRGNAFNTKVHVLFGMLWVFLTAVYATALYQNNFAQGIP